MVDSGAKRPRYLCLLVGYLWCQKAKVPLFASGFSLVPEEQGTFVYYWVVSGARRQKYLCLLVGCLWLQKAKVPLFTSGLSLVPEGQGTSVY